MATKEEIQKRYQEILAEKASSSPTPSTTAPSKEQIQARYQEILAQRQAPTPVEAPVEKPSLVSRATDFVKSDIFQGGVKKDTNLAGDIFRSTLGSRGLAGVAQLPGKAISQLGLLKESKELSESQQGLADITLRAIKKAQEEPDEDKKARLLKIARSNMQTLGIAQEAQNELDQQILTPRETLSTTANASLTTLTGSGAGLSKGLQTGAKGLSVGTLQKAPTLLPTVQKVATAGKGLIPRAIEQGAIGAGFTASENIRTGRPTGENVAKGALFGAALPVAGTVAGKAKSAIAPAKLRMSQRVVDSLIKPLLKDLSYGKNPGKRVATEGLVFNSLEQGAEVIGQRKKEVGELMNNIIETSPRADKVYDATAILNPIDEEIKKLAKNPRTNQAVINRLEDAKKDLLGVLEGQDGVQTRDLKNATLKEIIQLKKDVGELTKFTGNASDDKAYNQALKNAYGSAKQKSIEIEPKLREVNERYGDLLTAENAIKYRDKIEQRQNIFKFPSKTVGGLLTGAGIATLNPALIAVAVLEVGLDKALSSSAFKTRFAKWLAKSSVQERDALIRDLPVLKNILDRIFGKDKELTESQIKANLTKLSSKAGLSIEDVSGGKATVPTKLLQEAKKYKSAEEFVKAQGTPVYHGTLKDITIDELKMGSRNGKFGETQLPALYFTDNSELAKKFGSKKVLDAIVDKKTSYITKDRESLVREFGFGKTIDDFNRNSDEIRNILENKGYKSITYTDKLKNIEGLSGSEVVVFDKSAIKTKPQLEQIWKEANSKGLVNKKKT